MNMAVMQAGLGPQVHVQRAQALSSVRRGLMRSLQATQRRQKGNRSCKRSGR